MKLKHELNGLIDKYRALPAGSIKGYAEALRADGGYNDFETRLAWDLLRIVTGTAGICKFYDDYHCNDNHITTLAKAALRAVYKIGEIK